MTKDQIEELKAIHWTTSELKGPTMLWKGLWRDSDTGWLARRKYITWEKVSPDSRMRFVELTAKGRKVIEDDARIGK